MHGWYSKKSHDMYGVITYETPIGQIVQVTEVTISDQSPYSVWDDVVYVGPVTKCLNPLPILENMGIDMSVPNRYI